MYRGLHKGFGKLEDFLENFVVGSKFQNPAYTSVSADATVASEFSHRQEGVILRYALPKGQKSLPLGHYSGMYGEEEISLHRNIKVEFTQVTKTILSKLTSNVAHEDIIIHLIDVEVVPTDVATVVKSEKVKKLEIDYGRLGYTGEGFLSLRVPD